MEVLQRTANRGSISTGPYQIDNSLKFERDNSESIVTTTQAAGNQKTWTFSAWIKRSRLSYDWDNIFGAGTIYTLFTAEDDLVFTMYNGTTYQLQTDRKFRDTSAWYHIVVQLDTTQSTASNRAKIWVNGVQETSFSTETYPNQNDTFDLGGQGSSANWIQLGRFYSGSRHFSGYMADVYYLNGTAEDADAFGETDEDTGIWIPKAYTGSGYGTQGFHYKFDNASDLGEDSSGEGHNANQKNNITAADQATDTPTNNFATLLVTNTHADFTIANGATSYKNTTNNWRSAAASIAVQSGKWYAEFTPASSLTFIGVSNVQNFDFTTNYFGNWDTSIAYYGNSGLLFIDGATATFSGAGYGDGNKVGIAFDKDNGYVYWHKDGTWQNSGDPTSGSSGTGGIALTQGNSAYQASDIFYMGVSGAHPNLTGESNFGGFSGFTISSAASDANGYGTFEYAPPTGYYALCTKNLAEFG